MALKLFVASSVEGLEVARAIHANLEYDSEVTIWDHGVFGLSEYPIESLLRAIDQTDFGAFVFSADDLLRMRDTELHAVRDNVIFEMGLFIGRMGRERNFIIQPRGDDRLHLPTDLMGLTPGTFASRQDGNLKAALGPACDQIRSADEELGPFEHPANALAAPESNEEPDLLPETESMMPSLFREFREDLEQDPTIREFILLQSEGNIYNGGGVFVYYESKHEHLRSRIRILVSRGLVDDITFNNVPRYMLHESFVRYLTRK